MSDTFFSFDMIFGFFLVTIRYFGLRNDLSTLGIYCLTTFTLGEFFDDLLLGIFLTNCSSIRGGGSLGLFNFQKCVFLALKYDFFGEKKAKKSQFFSINDTGY